MICPVCLTGFDPPTPRSRFCSQKCLKNHWAKSKRAQRAKRDLSPEAQEHAEYVKQYGGGWIRFRAPAVTRTLKVADEDNDEIFRGDLSGRDVGYLAICYAMFGREKVLRSCLKQAREVV